MKKVLLNSNKNTAYIALNNLHELIIKGIVGITIESVDCDTHETYEDKYIPIIDSSNCFVGIMEKPSKIHSMTFEYFQKRYVNGEIHIYQFEDCNELFTWFGDA